MKNVILIIVALTAMSMASGVAAQKGKFIYKELHGEPACPLETVPEEEVTICIRPTAPSVRGDSVPFNLGKERGTPRTKSLRPPPGSQVPDVLNPKWESN